jgi:hypothetical protein
VDLFENIRVHGAFMHRHATDAARADDEHRSFGHEILSLGFSL